MTGLGIMDADTELEYLEDILKLCNIDYFHYTENNRLLTQEIIEDNIDNIISDLNSTDIIGYQILGVLILQTGAQLPGEVKDIIINSINNELNGEINALPPYIEIRKIYLKDFKKKILKHKRGIKSFLLELKKITVDEDLKNCCIGLEEYNEVIQSNSPKLIRNLNLDACNLDKIPESIEDFKNLETLSINHNQISTLDKLTNEFESLKFLYMKNNLLKNIPESFLKLKNLMEIDFSYNHLVSLPKNINFLRSLRILNLNYNRLISLPESLGTLKDLWIIDLNNNFIDVFPKNIIANPEYKGLYRTETSLKSKKN